MNALGDEVDGVEGDQNEAREHRAGKQIADGDRLGCATTALVELCLLIGAGDHVAQQHQRDAGWNNLAQRARGGDGARGDVGFVAGSAACSAARAAPG